MSTTTNLGSTYDCKDKKIEAVLQDLQEMTIIQEKEIEQLKRQLEKDLNFLYRSIGSRSGPAVFPAFIQTITMPISSSFRSASSSSPSSAEIVGNFNLS